MDAARRRVRASAWAGRSALALLVLVGCATNDLDRARSAFHAGRPGEAAHALTARAVPDTDRVLFLMERGTILQAEGRYAESAEDFIAAADELDRLRYFSVSENASSMVVNDNVRAYQGVPYEQTLLHALTALDHLALAHWENAAVEARRMLESLSRSEAAGYPDNPFARYLAGYCFEMIDDTANAELQYRLADQGLEGRLTVSPTGFIEPEGDTNAPSATPCPNTNGTDALTFFLLAGRAPSGREVWERRYPAQDAPPQAELFLGGECLGRAYELADTVEMAFTTEELQAAGKAAKTLGRVAFKEAIAYGVASSTDNDALGALTELILIGLLEQPDVRRWETLPRWFQVARVRVPSGWSELEVTLPANGGAPAERIRLRPPLQRRRNQWFALWRTLPGATRLGDD